MQGLHFTDAPWAVSRLPQVLPSASSRRSHPSPRAAESGDKEGSPDFSPGLSPERALCLEAPPISRGSGGASSALRTGRLFMRRISSFLKGQQRQWGPQGGTERNGTALAQSEQQWQRLPGQEGCSIIPLPGLGPGEDGGPRQLKEGVGRGPIVEKGIS